jgi:ParB/RepB/Spo0J family partition protein
VTKKLSLREQRKLEREQYREVQKSNAPATIDLETPSAMFQAKNQEEALQDVDIQFEMLNGYLNEAGISLDSFLEQKGITQSFGREMSFPETGEKYRVISTYLSVEQLKELKFNDNVREPSERQESELSDIIDEIGAGLQLSPIILYRNGDQLEAIDGSRRTAAAIFRGVGLAVEIIDEKPSEGFIQWVVQASDRKRLFSFYEKGKMFSMALKHYDVSQSKFATMRGYTRQEVNRCVRFYEAPKALLDLMGSKNLVQTDVEVFNKNVSAILEAGTLDDAVETVSAAILGTEKDGIALSKLVVKELNKFAAELLSVKKVEEPKTSDLSYGDVPVSVLRTKKVSRIKFEVPKDREQEALKLLEEHFGK